MKGIVEEFDNKVSKPIEEFNEVIKGSIASEGLQGKNPENQRVFYHVHNNLDIFENIISYVVAHKENKAFVECKKFRS